MTRDGQPAANRLEMLLLEAGMTCQTTQPTLSVLYDDKLPEEFLLKAVECEKSGTGYPAWMNNRGGIEFIMKKLRDRQGYEPGRCPGAFSIGGCLETSPGIWKELELNGKKYWIPGGAGQPTSVGVHFISNPKVLEMVLTNGYDRRIDLQVLPPHNKTFKTYEELYEQFLEYYDIVIDCLVTTNNIQHDVWRKT